MNKKKKEKTGELFQTKRLMLHEYCYKSRFFLRETAHWVSQEQKDDHVCPDHTTPLRQYTSPRLAILYVVVGAIQLIVLRRPYHASKSCFPIPLELRWKLKFIRGIAMPNKAIIWQFFHT